MKLLRFFLGIILFISFGWVLHHPGAHAEKKVPKKIMLVLDGSGSMWGEIKGKPKIEIAREVIGGLVKEWNPENHIGLSVYGHRRKGDCKDIQTLIPMGPLSSKTFMAKVQGINPKGKTPLSKAVQLAAKELKYTEDEATVILISDGKETCDLDPCAIGKQLEKSGVDFTAHVIGFDVAAKEERAQLKCLATNTGGEFLLASDASSLKEALGKVVKKSVAPKPGIRARLYMVPNSEPLKTGVWWEVYEAKEDMDGKRKKITYTSNAMPLLNLPPGKYLLQGKHGIATVQKVIEVKEKGNQPVDLVLNAGRVKAKAYLKAGGTYLDSGNWWEIFEPKEDINGKRNKITYTSETSPLFTLAAGEYVIALKHNNARVEKKVVIKAGKDQILNFDLNSGRVKCKGYLKQGNEQLKSGNWWEVYEAKKDINGKRKKITYTSEKSPLFTLTQGKYVLSYKHDHARIEKEITVNPDQDQILDFVLNAGQVKALAVTRKGGAQMGGNKWWEVFEAKEDINGKRKKITYTSSASPVFTLPQGNYVITLKNGDKKATEKISVKPGAAIKLEVVPK